MQPPPVRAQLLADLVDATPPPPPAAAPIAIHAGPGSTVIIYAQPAPTPSQNPDAIA